MSKVFKLYFEPKEKQRELELQKESDIVAWAEASGLPNGLMEDNIAWCRKCYFAKKGG